MSQVDRNPNLEAIKARSVWLVLEATQILWGAVLGSGRSARWEVWGSVPVPDGAPASRESLLHVLGHLPGSPFSGTAAGASLHVWIADRWVAMDWVPWSGALMVKGADESWVRRCLSEQGHEIFQSDVLRLDEAPVGQPRLSIAYPSEYLVWLEDHARAWTLSLASVRVASIACWSALRQGRSSGLLAIAHSDSVVFIASAGYFARGKRLVELKAAMWEGVPREDSPNDPSHDTEFSAQLMLMWRRMCLRFPHWSSVAEVSLVNGRPGELGVPNLPLPFKRASPRNEKANHPEQCLGDVLIALERFPEPHFLDAVSERRMKKFSLILLALVPLFGLLLLAVIAQKQSNAKDLLVAAVARASQPVYATQKSVPLSKPELARIPAVNQAIRQLNLPVHALLQALEPPKDLMVAVLSVDSAVRGAPSAGSPGVRIVARAPTSADMTRYVAFVAGRKPFTGAYLRKHEWVEGANQKQVQFTMEATWND